VAARGFGHARSIFVEAVVVREREREMERGRDREGWEPDSKGPGVVTVWARG
jgi:hypothetical protein